MSQTARIRAYPFGALESLTGREVAQTNGLLRWLGGPSDQIAGILEAVDDMLRPGRARIDLVGMTSHAASAPPRGVSAVTWNAFLTVPGSSASILLSIDGSLAQAWASVITDGEVVSTELFVEDDLRSYSAVTYLVLRAAAGLTRSGGETFVVETTPPPPAAISRFFERDAPLTEFAWVYSDACRRGFVRCFVPASFLADRAFEGSPAPSLPPFERYPDALRVRVSLAVARIRALPLQELRALAIGDLLLPDQVGLATPNHTGITPTDGTGFLIFRRAELPVVVSIVDGRWRCEVSDDHFQKHGASLMNQDTEIETQSLNISALHEAIVDVNIVVGSAELSVSDLGHLKRGSVITLDREVGESVDVSVDNEVVARGELVNVDGRLGVRITAISG